MKRPFEIAQAYKKETGNNPAEYEVSAHVGKFGDVILDGFDCEVTDIKDRVDKFGCLDFLSPDYVRWLEEKVMELLTKK